MLRMLLVGGPTVLIDWDGLRLLTDPTFDPAGSTYSLGPITLRKTVGPAIASSDVGVVHAVLLSHDEHADNLDTAGRELLAAAGPTITTVGGAERLGHQSIGLKAWSTTTVRSPKGESFVVTAVPARHGPEGCEPICGEVIGFVIQKADSASAEMLYISGDTVWYEGVAEITRRFSITTAILFLGAALMPEVGPAALTMTTDAAIKTIAALGSATIVPAHYDGWAHFSEGPDKLSPNFESAGLSDRVLWLTPGEWTTISA